MRDFDDGGARKDRKTGKRQQESRSINTKRRTARGAYVRAKNGPRGTCCVHGVFGRLLFFLFNTLRCALRSTTSRLLITYDRERGNREIYTKRFTNTRGEGERSFLPRRARSSGQTCSAFRSYGTRTLRSYGYPHTVLFVYGGADDGRMGKLPNTTPTLITRARRLTAVIGGLGRAPRRFLGRFVSNVLCVYDLERFQRRSNENLQQLYNMADGIS